MWWRGGSRSVKHRKVIGDLKTIRGSRSIWQREVNVDLQTRGGSRSVRHEEVNGFDIVKPRLNMSINLFTIGVPVALEHFCVNCTLIGAKGR